MEKEDLGLQAEHTTDRERMTINIKCAGSSIGNWHRIKDISACIGDKMLSRVHKKIAITHIPILWLYTNGNLERPPYMC